MGGDGLNKMLDNLEKCKAEGITQDLSKVTPARMIKNEFGLIKFTELSAI